LYAYLEDGSCKKKKKKKKKSPDSEVVMTIGTSILKLANCISLKLRDNGFSVVIHTCLFLVILFYVKVVSDNYLCYRWYSISNYPNSINHFTNGVDVDAIDCGEDADAQAFF
jgi:hypothetical protein